MYTTMQRSKALSIAICSICAFLFSSIFFSPAAFAQSTCASHASGTRAIGLPVYMTQITAQGASAITDNVGDDVFQDADVIRYEYELTIDAALESRLASATETCLIFTTSSKVKNSGDGLAEYAATLNIEHRAAGASSYQTFVQIVDARSTANGDFGVETIQYAFTLNLPGITLAAGDSLKIEIDGNSLADSSLGTPGVYANANLNWLISSAQIFQPRLLTY